MSLKATFDSCGARTTTGGINLYIKQEKHKLDQIAARNIRMSLDKRVAFSKVSYGISEDNSMGTKHVICDKDLPTELANNIIAAERGEQYRMQISNMFTVHFI